MLHFLLVSLLLYVAAARIRLLRIGVVVADGDGGGSGWERVVGKEYRKWG